MNITEMNIQGQWIDGYGKTRVVTVNDVPILISPTAILRNVKSTGLISTKLSIVFKLCKDLDVSILSKEVLDDGRVVGLWLNPSPMSDLNKLNSAYYYAIIKPTDPSTFQKLLKNIKDVDSNENLNLQVDVQIYQSDLLEIRKAKRISNVLKKYALFLYAHFPEKDEEGKLIKFPERLTVLKSESEVVKLYTDETIDSLPKRIDFDNDILTTSKKLIIPSKDIADRLIDYVTTYTLNYDPNEFKNLRLNAYETMDDFNKTPNETIFDDSSIIDKIAMITQQKFNIIDMTLNPNVRLPYIYMLKISENSGVPCIIQNVQDGLNSAITVALGWIRNKKNLGYKTKSNEQMVGENKKEVRIHTMKTHIDDYKFENVDDIHIIRYDERKFGAVLVI